MYKPLTIPLMILFMEYALKDSLEFYRPQTPISAEGVLKSDKIAETMSVINDVWLKKNLLPIYYDSLNISGVVKLENNL